MVGDEFSLRDYALTPLSRHGIFSVSTTHDLESSVRLSHARARLALILNIINIVGWTTDVRNACYSVFAEHNRDCSQTFVYAVADFTTP